MVSLYREVIKHINMSTLELKTCAGIGDLILTYSQLENLKKDFSEIKICPYYHLLNVYRSGSQELHEFTRGLANILFDKPPYKLIETSQRELMSPEQLFSLLRWSAKYVDLSDKLCLKENIRPCDSKYIVLQTKVRYIERDFFKNISEELFNTIKGIKNHKLVIMGERDMGSCKESKIHNNIFTIYDSIKNSFKDHEHIDLTKEVLIDSPNLDDFKKDLTIMRNSSCVIMLGVSGMTTATLATSNVVAGFRTDGIPLINDFCNTPDRSKKLVTENFTEFIQFIKRVTE